MKLLNKIQLPFNVNLERFTIIDNVLYFIDVTINDENSCTIPVIYKYDIVEETIMKLPNLEIPHSLENYDFKICDISIFKWKDWEWKNNVHYNELTDEILGISIRTKRNGQGCTHVWKFANNEWEHKRLTSYRLNDRLKNLTAYCRCGKIYNQLLDIWRWKNVPSVSLDEINEVPDCYDIIVEDLSFRLCKFKDNERYSLLCEYDDKYTIFNSSDNCAYVFGSRESSSVDTYISDSIDSESMMNAKFSHSSAICLEPNIEHISCIDNEIYFLDMHDNKFPRKAYKYSIEKNEFITLPRIPYTVSNLIEEEVEAEGYIIKWNNNICIAMKVTGEHPKRKQKLEYYLKLVLNDNAKIWNDVSWLCSSQDLKDLFNQSKKQMLYNQLATLQPHGINIHNIRFEMNPSKLQTGDMDILIPNDKTYRIKNGDIEFSLIVDASNSTLVAGIYCIHGNKVVTIFNRYNNLLIFDIEDDKIETPQIVNKPVNDETNEEKNVLEPEYLFNQLELKRVQNLPIKIGFYFETVLIGLDTGHVNREIEDLLKKLGYHTTLICFTNSDLMVENAAAMFTLFENNDINCNDICCVPRFRVFSITHRDESIAELIDCDIILDAKAGLTQTVNTLKRFVESVNSNESNNKCYHNPNTSLLENGYPIAKISKCGTSDKDENTLIVNCNCDWDGDVFGVYRISSISGNKSKVEKDNDDGSENKHIIPHYFEVGKFYYSIDGLDYSRNCIHIIHEITPESKNGNRTLIAVNVMGEVFVVDDSSIERFSEVSSDIWYKRFKQNESSKNEENEDCDEEDFEI